MAKQKKTVALLVGWEETFPKAFLEAVNRKGNGEVEAVLAKVGVTKMSDEKTYDVIVDRISHEIHMYKPWLKNQALKGAYVINDPFWWLADDKFFDNALVEQLGVAVPKTVVLPSFTPNPNTSEKSHRNMMLMDWEEIFNYVGFPCFLKPYDGGGWKHVYKCRTPQDVFENYAKSGQLVMVLQEGIEFESYCRCLCIGKDTIIPIKYDPGAKERTGFGAYVQSEEFEKGPLAERILRDARVINHALGYDMNSVEFAIRDGIPYAIDFMNPAPDMDFYSLTEPYFKKVVDAFSDYVIDLAKSGADPNTRHYPWRELLKTGGKLPEVKSAVTTKTRKAAAPKAKTAAAATK